MPSLALRARIRHVFAVTSETAILKLQPLAVSLSVTAIGNASDWTTSSATLRSSCVDMSANARRRPIGFATLAPVLARSNRARMSHLRQRVFHLSTTYIICTTVVQPTAPVICANSKKNSSSRLRVVFPHRYVDRSAELSSKVCPKCCHCRPTGGHQTLGEPRFARQFPVWRQPFGHRLISV